MNEWILEWLNHHWKSHLCWYSSSIRGNPQLLSGIYNVDSWYSNSIRGNPQLLCGIYMCLLLLTAAIPGSRPKTISDHSNWVSEFSRVEKMTKNQTMMGDRYQWSRIIGLWSFVSSIHPSDYVNNFCSNMSTLPHNRSMNNLCQLSIKKIMLPTFCRQVIHWFDWLHTNPSSWRYHLLHSS